MFGLVGSGHGIRSSAQDGTKKDVTDQRTRELLEAYIIQKSGDNCVSTPSVALTQKEIAYMDG